jgi:hypothetical protein
MLENRKSRTDWKSGWLTVIPEDWFLETTVQGTSCPFHEAIDLSDVSIDLTVRFIWYVIMK